MKKKVIIPAAAAVLVLAVTVVLLIVLKPFGPRRYGPPPRITVNLPETGGGAPAFGKILVPAAREDRGFYIYEEILPEEEYVRLMPERLADPVSGDLWYVVNNSALRRLSDRGLIIPFSPEIRKKWKSGIPESFWTLGVAADGNPYYVPVTWYPWGIYYRKSVFREAGVEPPATWEEFLSVCESLKARGITPVGMTDQVRWPLLAWFDYLDLRLNGTEKHARWMALDLPFTDPGIVRVAETLVDLRVKGYMQPPAGATEWEILPRDLAEGKTGMVLCGSFFMNRIPETLREDIGWFPFPSTGGAERAEIVSGSGFVFSARAPNRDNALALLAYLLDPDFQVRLNDGKSGLLPVSARELKQLDRVDLTAGYERAAGSDRLFEMSERGMDGRMILPFKALLPNFLTVDHKDIPAVLNVLEEERRKILLDGNGD